MGLRCRPHCYPGRHRGRALGRRPPARAEVEQNNQQYRDLLRERGMLGPRAPATGGTQTLTARQRSRYAQYDIAFSVVGTGMRVRSGAHLDADQTFRTGLDFLIDGSEARISS